jgi:hypothetical protein
MAVGTKEDTKPAKGRSHNNYTLHSGVAVKGFFVGSMRSTLTTTPINALRQSKRSWSGKLRRR